MADLFQPLPLRSWGPRLAAWRESGRARSALTAAGGLLAVGLLVAMGLAFLRSSQPAPGLTLPRAAPGSAAPAPGAAGGGAIPAPPAPASAAMVTVHVAGHVAGPGVYALPAGGRVADAIVAAGGTSAEADLQQLNLAARISDGERIYVARKGETPPPAPVAPLAGARGGAAAGPVDLNTATAEQLEALPGIGPATSAAILAYRSSHGRFRSVTELLEVPGIGPAKLDALRPLVRI